MNEVLVMLLGALRDEEAAAAALADRLREQGAEQEAERLLRLLGLAEKLRLLRDSQGELVESLRLDEDGRERDLDGGELEELYHAQGLLDGLDRALGLLDADREGRDDQEQEEQEEDEQPCGYFCCGACYGSCDGNHTGECCAEED